MPRATEECMPVLLSRSFYVVSGSISLEARALKPFSMALNTGTGYILINRRVLPQGYEEYLTWNTHVLALCYVNRKRFVTHSAVVINVGLDNSLFTTHFMASERPTVDVLIYAEFPNRNLRVRNSMQMSYGFIIECWSNQASKPDGRNERKRNDPHPLRATCKCCS